MGRRQFCYAPVDRSTMAELKEGREEEREGGIIHVLTYSHACLPLLTQDSANPVRRESHTNRNTTRN